MRQLLQDSSYALWPTCFVLVALSCLTFATFRPVLNYEFVDLDVDAQVVKNPHIRSLSAKNVKDILTSRSMTSYYPVRTLSFAVDYQFWGLNPRGFKLTNVLCHLLNVLLLFWLIIRMLRNASGDRTSRGMGWDVCAAGLSAGVFAVHPVVVEPVTWVAGREELLMTLGALGAVHFHLSARQAEFAGNRRNTFICRAGTVLCCAAACLSNAVAAVIPLLITAWDLLTLSPPRFRKILGNTWMLWIIGVGTIVIKKLVPDSGLLVGHATAFSAERLMLALSVYWLNLKTLCWPTDLAIAYTRISPRSWFDAPVVAGLLAVCLSGTILWRFRRRKSLLFGLIWFGLALAPSSQLMPHHWIRADRFLYLPLAGLVLAMGIGLSWLVDGLKRRWAGAGLMVTVLVLVIVLLRVTAVQIATWRCSESLWEQCVSVSPDSPVAQGGLADSLVNSGQFGRAIPHYRMALQIDPNNKETLNNFALELAANDNRELRDYPLAIELAAQGCEVTGWKDQKLRHTLAMAYNNLALDLASRGEYGQSRLYYGKAIAADPFFEAPLFNLALLLATCSDQSLRSVADAIQYAEQACKIVDRLDPNGLWILATAYAEAREFSKAIATLDEAIGLALAGGDMALVDKLRSQQDVVLGRALNETTQQE